MGLMTDKDKKFKNTYEFTYCQHFQGCKFEYNCIRIVTFPTHIYTLFFSYQRREQ